MSDRGVAAMALLVAMAAWSAVGVSWWLIASLCLVGVVFRRAVLVVLAVALATSTASAGAIAGVNVADGWSVAGRATLVSDPAARPGGVSCRVRVDGRRFLAFIPNEEAGEIQEALVGDSFDLRGTASRFDESGGWVRSSHLAGRLSVRGVGPRIDAAPWWAAANAIRRTVENGLSGFSSDEAALFTGVVYGDDRLQSDLTRHRFRTSGLSHLLAVSGQNVALMLVAFNPLLAMIPLRARWMVILVALAGFVLITRFEPSVLRAAAMAGIAAGFASTGRVTSGVRVVCLAVTALLLVDPLLVYSVGFQLSVAATLALVVFSGPLSARIPAPRWLALPLAVGLSAQAGTAPLLVGYFGRVPLLSPVTNLVGGVLAGALMVWGVVSGPIGGMGSGGLEWVNVPSLWTVRALSGLARWGSVPGLPMVGGWGAAGMLAVPLYVVSTSGHLDRRKGMLAAGLVFAAVGVSLSSGGQEGSTAGASRGLRLLSEEGAHVLIIDHPATSPAAFGLVERHGVQRLALVIVLGGGRNSRNVVWDLRQGLSVGTVLAAPTDGVPDALPVVDGVVRVGKLELVVSGTSRGDPTVRARSGV